MRVPDAQKGYLKLQRFCNYSGIAQRITHISQVETDIKPLGLHSSWPSQGAVQYLAPTKKEANLAFNRFVETFSLKYPKAVKSLTDNKERLLTFYDYPAEHWLHLRSSNVIESVFATVRLRTYRTKGCGTTVATLSMVYKLLMSAQKRWKRLHGHLKVEDVMNGVKFKDGMEVSEKESVKIKG